MKNSRIARPMAGSETSAGAGGRLSATAAIPKVECRSDLPLSFAQERLWFLAQIEGGSKAYQNLHGLQLRGELDRAALRRALNQIVARHESLRTVFTLVNEKPLQRIASKDDSQFHLIEHDLRECDRAAAELERLIAEEAGTSMDLNVGPLIRGRLIRQGDEEYVLLITIHHIISDAWSFGLFSKELSSLYGAYVRGEEDGLPELGVQYADCAVWQRKWMGSELLGKQAEYWKRALAGAPEVLQLPADHVRPEQQSYSGATARLVLDEELTAGLRGLSRKHKTTLYMTVLAGWAALLARLSGQDEVVIGTPAANRNRVEIERLIGFFVNTLALRLGVSDSFDVGELLAHVRSRVVAAQEHQGIPFEQVVEIVRPPRSLAHNPVFQVMFSWQNNPKGTIDLPGLQVSPFTALPHDISKFDLTLSLHEEGNQIVGWVEYATALFERSTIERYLGYFRNLLGAMVTDDSQRVDRLPMLPQEERQQLLYEWNATEVGYPSERCVHELFEEQVGKSPEAVAVVYEEASLSYGELNRRANRLAHYLRELGVRPDERVAICVERSLEMVVGILGILKAGGAYVPLDPAYPGERLQFMVEDSAPAVLLTQKHLQRLFSGIGESVQVLDLIGGADAWSREPETNPDPAAIGLSSEHLAYITYTSGSTGTPKAVMAEHRAVSSLIVTQVRLLAVESASRILQFASLSFDASTPEIWNALCGGAALYVAPQGAILIGEALKQVIKRSGITHAKFPPTVLATLPESSDLDTLETLMVSAEILTESLAKQWLPGRRLINLYGPTETTVHATLYDCDDQKLGTPPIGRPIANKRAYILDKQGEPIPVGVAGELYIGGAGVSRGYLNGVELTAERFVPDPYSGEAGARMYRTGDLGRWQADGTIEFLGRNDFQVKVRGFRIELGEIEARLSEHKGVQEAVVLAREDMPGEKRLVAYYTAREQNSVGAQELRAHLAAKLPEYMVPAAYVRLESLPLTPNGKLDRKALPAPEGDAYGVRQYEAPQGTIEELLAGIWAELLKLERVGRHDNFFELGGHSLMAVRVIARVRETLKVEVTIRDLFARPVLEDFAGALAIAAHAELPAITRAPRGERIPLSLAQQRLWFLAQMQGVSEAYHIRTGWYLKGEMNRAGLRRALDRLVARHEVLRTTFAFVEGEPVQQIAPAEDSRFHLVEHDLRHHTDAKEELKRVAAEEWSMAFDLEAGPLIRGLLIRQGNEEYVFLIAIHHIVSDAWSFGVFSNELSSLYGAYVRGEEDGLPELGVQYADYAVWQRKWLEGEVLGKQAEYWKRALAGAPEVLQLPADHVRPEQQSYSGSAAKLVLDEELTAGLRGLSRKHKTTLYMTVLAGWAALLARLSGQDEVVIGTPIANRNRVEIEGLIGFFVNTLAVRLGVSETATVGELLERVKGQVLAAQEHEDIPFEQVVEIVRPSRSLAHNPVFQVGFAWQNAPKGTINLPGLQVSPFTALPHDISKFDLQLSLHEEGNQIVGGVEYATALYERSTIERYLGYFRNLLEAMVADDTQAVDRLPLLEVSERHRVLYEWNQTRTEFPSDKCVHELFEEQVAKTPEATAVVFEEEELSYAELNRRANRLAHYLRELGVRPDDRVAICVERSLEMIIALLAVLKAGGAYVPLDPAYPVERLRFMIEDSAPAALLTQSHLEKLFAGIDDNLPVLDLTAATPPWQEHPETNPVPNTIGLGPQHLAYVVYTSGSTGSPKGVLVTHLNVVRLVQNTNYVDFTPPQTIGHLSSVAFDAATFEIWGALLNGCRLAVIPRFDVLAPENLALQLQNLQVSTLCLTTPLFNECIRIKPNIFHRMDQIIFGGEMCDPQSIRQALKKPPQRGLFHLYGPTEITVFASYFPVETVPEKGTVPIGRPIANTRIYILDAHGEPVPVGVTGELYIGGTGVARGYLNCPELTAEKFLKDPFTDDANGRMYRTGDLGRWLSDGNIEFLGRNDFQIKLRGFRIELGEIEARLSEHKGVQEAVVLVREDTPGDKRLVAYYTAREQNSGGAEALRAHLAAKVPEYMVPAAYVRLESWPLTPNGKLNRKALPAPEGDAYVVRQYEPPQGEIEELLASIWAEVLNLERVGRHDNFFELGGHSLLAVTLSERMRRNGFAVNVRAVFATTTLAELAATTGGDARRVEAPPNLIPTGCQMITPEMLTLVELTQEEIDEIARGVPGGAANIQDIYPLAPLQEGILFHHLMGGEGDPYVVAMQFGFDSRDRLDRYITALQAVIDRHDILRTAVVWEGLRERVQVVWRRAELAVEEIELDGVGGDAREQLYARCHPRRMRIDVRRAPMLRLCIGYDSVQDRWLMVQLLHHLAGDHTTLEVMYQEVQAHLRREESSLPQPLPFRNLVAQARLGVSQEEHEAFFRQMLGDVEEPTAPFGLLDVQGDGSGIEDAHLRVDEDAAGRLRKQARRLGVSAASLCHLAWAQVLARVSEREDVVFGTVLFGRMQGGQGADRVMGLFINTLPVRIHAAEEGVEASVRRIHNLLAELLGHEHASLALVQRCSRVAPPTPLFSALLNYRHSPTAARARSQESLRAWEGIEPFRIEERSNYPFTLSVSDFGEGFSLAAQTPASVGPLRVCRYMHTALASLAEALESSPVKAVRALEILPPSERRQLLYEWNDTKRQFPSEQCVHQLFEQQVEKTPEAVAVVYEGEQLSYVGLNRRANQLAHYLRELGVRPDDRVAICAERGLDMVVGLLGVLKAGGAYVPLDPAFPAERLRFMLEDSAPVALLTQTRLQDSFIKSDNGRPIVLLDAQGAAWRTSYSDRNPTSDEFGVTAQNLACIIYTSGSTGTSKGVAVQHVGIVNLVHDWITRFGDRVRRNAVQASLWTSFGFDVSIFELFAGFCLNATVNIVPEQIRGDARALFAWFVAHNIAFGYLPPLFIRDEQHTQKPISPLPLELVLVGVESSTESALYQLQQNTPGLQVVNGYGPAETTVFSTTYPEIRNMSRNTPIGRPLANTRIYILDAHGEPVPVGVTGELYIGGTGVARGYLNRPELTAQKFVKDPFCMEAGARMYRTGDLGRWLADGNIEFLGRNDFQVKIRGFRIELGEIEARLSQHAGVQEAVVLAREDTPGDKRLVAYYTPAEQSSVGAQELRSHLAAKLPEYMVPAAYVRLESLPLTPNGKLDRGALPAPEADAYVVRQYEAPQGAIEELLAGIWAELLNLERVGRHDNFFELGGHSLTAVSLMERVARAGLKADVRALFTTPTLAELAASLDTNVPALETPANRIPSPKKIASSPSIVELSI